MKGDDCMYDHKSPNTSLNESPNASPNARPKAPYKDKIWTKPNSGETAPYKDKIWIKPNSNETAPQVHKTWIKPNSGEDAPQVHKTWVKPKKQEPSVEEPSIEQDEDSQESESEEIDEQDLNVQAPPPNINKGKNLRNMLNKMRENRPPVTQPEESSSNESEEAYNSDTFGNVNQTKFQGNRNKEVPKMIYNFGGPREEFKEEERLSNIDSVGEEEENIDIPVEHISVPSNLIKISDEKPFDKIQQIVMKAESEKHAGRNPSIVTEKAKLVRM
jgi:hypothetical protein